MRSGWPRNEIRGLTPSEAREVLEEIDTLEDRAESRAIEAYRNPQGFYDRLKKKEAKRTNIKPGLDGWKRFMAHMTGVAGVGGAAEKLKGIEIKQAAHEFLRKSNGRRN